jgi:triacylglycerol esterase/lipase EstA (alpha/beta hydrolase family)
MYLKCGISAVENLLHSVVYEDGGHGGSSLTGYSVMRKYFEAMGYQIGLTLFGLPYDWRRIAGDNQVAANLLRTLEYIFALTGKKSVIITHSMGGLNVLQALNQISQEKKD